MSETAFLDELLAAVGPDGLFTSPGDLVTYECDAYTLERHLPVAVVLPKSTAEVASVVRAAARHGVPVVPRGAGTSLAGGAVPTGGAVLLSLTRMNQIL